MTQRTKRLPMPNVLTGKDGEVESVTQWPLTDKQAVRLKASDAGMCDAIIHFANINVRGRYNARRVMYDGRFYVRFWDRKLGAVRKVRIGGALVFDVLDVVTRCYWPKGASEREKEALAARVQET